jgi:hypothetical protein
MCDAKIGEKVVCVDDRVWTSEKGTYLFYKSTYEVKDIIVCEKCGNIWFDIGCRTHDVKAHSKCCNTFLAGAGIDWVGAERFVPAIKNFKNYCRKQVTEQMQKDITELITKKEYEEAVKMIKRLENIHNEL